MKPYYDQDGIVIYHADCREVLPNLEPVDLVLTDPPYGIGREGMRATSGKHGGRKAYHALGNWDQSIPDGSVFGQMFSISSDQIIWGANYFTPHLPPSMGWLVWNKGQNGMLASSDAELAFTSLNQALRVYTLNRVALMMDGALHPTQKPLRLMKWCLSFAPTAQTVLDPFMGSGTTLRAAKDLSLRAIGIEIEEKYCEIAAERLRQRSLFQAEAVASKPYRRKHPICSTCGSDDLCWCDYSQDDADRDKAKQEAVG